MPIPNADKAIIHEDKLRAYLLSPSHKYGSPKAAFFASRGYNLRNWRLLEAALRQDHLTKEAEAVEVEDWGVVYVIIGDISGPIRTAAVRSVWIVEDGTDTPRLVTAYPQR